MMAHSGESESIVAALRSFQQALPPELAETLAAAAVPHWFDAAVLAAILDLPGEQAAKRYELLQRMPLVQPMPETGHTVHELARHTLLEDLWRQQRETYVLWSRRAADFFASQAQEDPRARIESIYHRLLADPDKGADEVWNWGAKWNNTFQYTLLHSLIQAGLEHDAGGRLAGRAKGWVYYRHGLLQITYNEYPKAREALEIAADVVGGDPQLAANCIQRLGDVHLQLAEYEAARRRYEEALPLYRDIGARLGAANCIKSLGDVHLQLAEYEAARRRYEEALPLYRDIGDRLGAANCIQSLGDVHLQLAEYEAARRRYEEALPLYRDIGARLGAANCIQSLGDVHLAQEDEVAATDYFNNAFNLYLDLGLQNAAAGVLTSQTGVFERRHDYAAALPLFTRIIEISPANAMWYRNRANAHIKLKDAAAAAADIAEAERLQPGHAYLHLRRGDLAILQGDYEVALTEFTRFVEAYPRNNGGHFALARAHLLQRQPDPALQSLAQALSLTYEAQDVRDAIYDLEQMQSEHGDLPGLSAALTRLHAWLAAHP